MSYKDPIIFFTDSDEPAKVLLSDFQELESQLKKFHDPFLEDALKALNWQGGTRKQVLMIISAARNVASARKEAELKGNYEDLPKYLDALENCFYT